MEQNKLTPKEKIHLIYDCINWTIDTLTPYEFMTDNNSQECYEERMKQLEQLKKEYKEML